MSNSISKDSNQTYSIRLSQKDHDDAVKVFDKLGLDWSNGIKIYLKQIIRQEAIPFSLTSGNISNEHKYFTPNEETARAIEIAHAEDQGLIPDTAKDFTSAEEAIKYLFRDK